MSAGDNFVESGLLLGRGGSVDAFVDRISQLPSEFTIDFARIFSHARRDFRGEQTRNDSVLVRGPDAAVAPKKRGAGAFFAGKTQPASEQAFDEPLEANGHFVERPLQPRGDAIDHAAADHGLPDGDISRANSSDLRINSGCRRKGSGSGQQAAALGDDAVAVVVGIAGKCNVELVFQPDESLHGVRRGGIHANLAVPIHGHESKRWIDRFVHDGQIETVLLGDQRPIIDARASERVDAELDLGIADRRHIDDGFEIVDVGVQKVVLVRRGGSQRLRETAFA